MLRESTYRSYFLRMDCVSHLQISPVMIPVGTHAPYHIIWTIWAALIRYDMDYLIYMRHVIWTILYWVHIIMHHMIDMDHMKLTSNISMHNLISVTDKKLPKFLETNSTQSTLKSSVSSLFVRWSIRYLHWLQFQLFYFFKKLLFLSLSPGYCIIHFYFCKFYFLADIKSWKCIYSGYFYQKANFERIWSFHIWNHYYNQRLVFT